MVDTSAVGAKHFQDLASVPQNLSSFLRKILLLAIGICKFVTEQQENISSDNNICMLFVLPNQILEKKF